MKKHTIKKVTRTTETRQEGNKKVTTITIEEESTQVSVPEFFGFARNVTGGGQGEFKKVATRQELIEALKDPNASRIDIIKDIDLNDATPETASNKTVKSSNGSVLRNLRWRIKGENILIMNLLLTQSKDDLMTLDGAKNIYIKNCTFDSRYGLPFLKHPRTPVLADNETDIQQNVFDGQLDMIGVRNVTIDSCVFANHDKVSLIRTGSDRISILNSVFSNTFQRCPQATGKVHFANNVYLGVKYGMRAIEEGNLLVEGNMFVDTERVNRNATTYPNAYATFRNNYFENAFNPETPIPPPNNLAWEPDYFFEVLAPSKRLLDTIVKKAGNKLHL